MKSKEKQSMTGVMRLCILQRGRVVRAVKVKASTLTIGSGRQATLRVRGVPDVAPEHALIWRDEGVPTLVPSSGCEARVNGRVTRFARLRPDDVLSLGQLDLKVQVIDGISGLHPTPGDKSALCFDEETTQISKPKGLESSTWPLLPEAKSVGAASASSELGDDGDIGKELFPIPFDDSEPTIPEMSDLKSLEGVETSQAIILDAESEEVPCLPPSVSDSQAPEDLFTEHSFFDEDDEDDDDEENFVEPFSLVEHLKKKLQSTTGGPRERYVVAHVVRHSDGRVWEVASILPGQRYELGSDGPLLEMGTDGTCSLPLNSCMGGSIGRGDSETSLDQLGERLGASRQLKLSEGDWASLESDGCNYILQIKRPPRPTPPSIITSIFGVGLLMAYALIITSTLGGGAVAFASLSGTDGSRAQLANNADREVVHDEALTLFPPDIDVPREPIEVEPENVTEEEESSDPARGPPSSIKRVTRRPLGSTSAYSRLLDNLQQQNTSQGPINGDLVNPIDATKGLGRGAFELSGFLGKLPEGEGFHGRPGGGPVKTISWGDIRPGLPPIGGVPEGTRPPRPSVRARPPHIPGPGPKGCTIDRAAVRRAVNRKIGRITRCYETRLLSNPELSGRVILSWTINTSGGVSGVRVRTSNLSDRRVTSCVMDVVRSMRFPEAEKCSVVVSFPFHFRPL